MYAHTSYTKPQRTYMIISGQDNLSLIDENQTEEIVVFTHNDLDMCGCVLNMEFKFPNIKKKYFYTNYANILEITKQIIAYQKEKNVSHIIMPDVSFSDNVESLREIYNNFKYCTHIDHHLYPDNFWDEFPKMYVIWDKEKSATKLLNEYFKNRGKNGNLDTLTYLIDVYDLWKTDSEHFLTAQDLNEYFWRKKGSGLIEKIIQNNFKLPHDYFEIVNKIRKEYNSAIEAYEQKNLIHRSGEITLAFVNEWFNQVQINEMNNGKNFVIGVNSYGIVKVRINQKSKYTEQQLNRLRLKLTGVENIGHTHAFTYKIQGVINNDVIIKEVQRVISVIVEVINEKN